MSLIGHVNVRLETLVTAGGYVLGAIAAGVFRLTAPQIIAVSIETALQNPSIAFVLLQLSLDQPEADLTAIPIVAQLFMTGIPMWLVYLAYVITKRVRRRNKKRRCVIPSNDNDKLAEMTSLNA